MNMMSVHDWLPQWFSESGKLVLKLFEEIRRLVDNIMREELDLLKMVG